MKKERDERWKRIFATVEAIEAIAAKQRKILDELFPETETEEA
jgi:hypothetical protein